MKYYSSTSVERLQLNLIAERLMRQAEKLRSPVHNAMAVQFRQCVFDNFGPSGMFRPFQWAKLSPRYARKVGRDYATLNVTGKLRSAIKMASSEVKGTVSVSKADCDYSLAHQFGYEKNNLPARPYFPINTDGTVLNAVKELVRRSAALALTANLRNR